MTSSLVSLNVFKGRFDDIINTECDNLFNVLVKILDTEVYPEQGGDNAYGEDEVKLVIDRFRPYFVQMVVMSRKFNASGMS